MGDNGCAVRGCEQGANMSPINNTGVLVMGFVGPIPCGCRTVSNMQIGAGVGGFRVGVAGKYEFTGFDSGYCLR